MAYVVTAKWTAKEGQADVIAAALAKLAVPSRAEPGMLMYQLHRDPENTHVFFIYEQYRAEEDYRAHGSSAHFQQHGVAEEVVPFVVELRDGGPGVTFRR